jgi:Flavodoxin
MRALVVYESMFGNTEAVARAVAEGLSEAAGDVEVRHVSTVAELDELSGVGLLVVGGPTHAFGLSRESTRRDAARQGGHSTDPPGRGLREWLESASARGAGVSAAAFDTRVKAPVPGSAARAIARRLHRRGFHLVAHPETFFVTGTQGPLRAGEVERARRWGASLAGLPSQSPHFRRVRRTIS